MNASRSDPRLNRAKNLLFIHGYPLDRSMWELQLLSLPSEIQAVAVNLSGFGENALKPSEAGRGGSGKCSMESYADRCIQFLDQQDMFDPVVICGLSMGGYVAFEIWNRHPNRVKAMILCDTRAAADTSEGKALRKSIADRVLQEGTEAVVKPMIEKLLGKESRLNNQMLVQKLTEMMHRVTPATIHRDQIAMMGRADFTLRLPEIKVPCLLVVGEEDAISTPVEMQGMADVIPNARLTIIPRAAHLPPMENPIAFNAEIEKFLATIA
jgi:3-oxoadipate enol-lactonase